MNRQEQEMVNWFKAELRSYLHDKPRVRHLENRLALIDRKMGVHSPNLSGMHYAPIDHDSKLAAYIVEKEKVEKELRIIEAKREMVEGILSKITEPGIADAMRQIYSGRKSITGCAYEIHMSVRSITYHINYAILRALTDE